VEKEKKTHNLVRFHQQDIASLDHKDQKAVLLVIQDFLALIAYQIGFFQGEKQNRVALFHQLEVVFLILETTVFLVIQDFLVVIACRQVTGLHQLQQMKVHLWLRRFLLFLLENL
jgi:hypothetical protein